jgi:cytochrome c oxidase subunit 2
MQGSKSHLLTALLLAFLVLILVPVWFLVGAVGGSAHSHGGMMMMPDAFQQRIDAQQEAFGLEDGSVRPSWERPVYIMARQFAFVPHTIRLERGRHYDLAFYSPDVLHGSTLVDIGGGTLNAVILPKRMTMLSIDPTQAGELRIICNEFCGIGHHLMKATLIIEDAVAP